MKRVIPTTKRQWFYRVEDDQQPGFDAVCKKKHWTPVETFGSWNDNDESLGLAIDSAGKIFLIGSKPHIQELTSVEAMEFLAAMFHESKEGSDEEGTPQFFLTIAAQLRKGGA